MKRLELWRWRYFDPVRKRHTTTRFVLSEADAAEQFPGATKVGWSLEVREVPETDEEMQAMSASSIGRSPTTTCPICLGARWVCEDHPDKPWEHGGCGGAGAPCICNPKGAVEFVKVIAERPSDEPLQ